LTKANFTVKENDAEQPITSAAPIAVSGENAVPIDVVLTIDRSGSMQEEYKMWAAIKAARTFVDLMQPGDQAKIISFSDNVQDYGGFTSAKQKLASIIAELKPGGRTALYDAVATSIRSIQGRRGRNAAIVLTDGIENASKIKYPALAEILEKSSIPVYAIGLGNTLDEPAMQQIVWDTSGRYYHAPDADGLEALYRSISHQLHQLYIIKYKTSAYLRSGTVHSVTVSVNDGGVQAQDVKGYSGVVETR
jgi:VWFA-related protein